MPRPNPKSVSVLLLLTLAACEAKAPPTAETPAAAATPAPPPSAAPTPARSAEPVRTAPPTKPAPDATPPKEAQRTKSGLRMLVLTSGTGKSRPKKTDSVRVSFTGWVGGRQAFATPEPTVMPVEQMAPGWQEAVMQMVDGEKRRLWLPAAIAYGPAPGGPGPTDDLIMELELAGVVEPPPVPKDLKQPPKDATKTASGLVYKTLTKGKGTQHPTAASRVTVHYSGWNKDGKMFDSSVVRGSPTSFSLGQVIPGWTEGVQLMVEGEKTRFWIPAKLAYGEKPQRPEAPAGDLVFDVELLAIR